MLYCVVCSPAQFMIVFVIQISSVVSVNCYSPFDGSTQFPKRCDYLYVAEYDDEVVLVNVSYVITVKPLSRI